MQDRLLVDVGRRVRELRAGAGLTQAALADRTGLSLRFLGQIEAGAGNVSLERLAAVARALGVSVGALVGGTSDDDDPAVALAREVLQGRTAGEARELLRLARALGGAAGGRRGGRVALLGIRGAGKSAVGARLARARGVPFVELDGLVEEQAGMPLAAIFEVHGEAYFHDTERQALARLLADDGDFVVATGGSLVTQPELYEALARACVTVWLKATPEDHWRRVVAQGDARPMRENPRAMDQLRSLWSQRAPLYAAADVVVDTTGASPAAVARAVAARLPSPTPRARAAPRRGGRPRER
ncbi:MAG: helix-turn-helix domain-containing protein [Polyangiaceae bacterium]|nr:helix-turn-helix domain-containing protein [Polyangiaceae bacterium]